MVGLKGTLLISPRTVLQISLAVVSRCDPWGQSKPQRKQEERPWFLGLWFGPGLH
jgi:hypothetical protein